MSAEIPRSGRRSRRRRAVVIKALCALLVFSGSLYASRATGNFFLRAQVRSVSAHVLNPNSTSVMPHVLYLNLKRRHDRRVSIENQMRKANIQADRIEAVHVEHDDTALSSCWDPKRLLTCAGRLGCQRSHVKALEYAAEKEWPHVAIFEDDFVWADDVNPQLVLPSISQVQAWSPTWDVIAISLSISKFETIPEKQVRVGVNKTSILTTISAAGATHGYMVRSHLYSTLIQIFSSCDVQSSLGAAIDVCWNSLQNRTKWYGLVPQLGKQAESYSDIEGRIVSYPMIK